MRNYIKCCCMKKEQCLSPTKSTQYPIALYRMFPHVLSTEKAPGMFGTLVICLPSEYEGGAVVVSHHGENKVFQTASAFDHTYIAW